MKGVKRDGAADTAAQVAILIKKNTKFSIYIRKFRWDQLQNAKSNEEGLPNV